MRDNQSSENEFLNEGIEDQENPHNLDSNPQFTHLNFQIRTDDDLNVCLYRKEKVEIREGAGRGKGTGTATGTYKDKWVHKGFYSSFNSAFWKMTDLLAIEKQDVTELKQLIKEMKSIGDSFGKKTMAQIQDQSDEKALSTLKAIKFPGDPSIPKVKKFTLAGVEMKPRGRKPGFSPKKKR